MVTKVEVRSLHLWNLKSSRDLVKKKISIVAIWAIRASFGYIDRPGSPNESVTGAEALQRTAERASE